MGSHATVSKDAVTSSPGDLLTSADMGLTTRRVPSLGRVSPGIPSVFVTSFLPLVT